MATDSATSTKFTLPDVLDLQAAGPLLAQMLALRGTNLTLEGSNVRRLGGQCLQILLAALTAWAADGKTIVIATPSDAFNQAVSLFGADFSCAMSKETLT